MKRIRFLTMLGLAVVCGANITQAEPAATSDRGTIVTQSVDQMPPAVGAIQPGDPAASSVKADTCAGQMPGDLDGNGTISISDLAFLQAFLFLGGPAPNPLSNADVNGDCRVNIGDILCLVKYGQGSPSCVVTCTCVNPDLTQCCYGERGNIDYDVLDQVDISDLIYLTDYSFNSGPAPFCFEEADVNGDLSCDMSDVIYMVDYMFKTPAGPPPVSCP
jgi:hypothetical protein